MPEEIYFSTDIESDGPIPGPHSMLSFASAAISADGKVIATYSANLELLEGAAPEPKTAEFWAKNRAAYESTRQGTRSPLVVMPEYVAWVESIPGRPVFVGYPVTFDFMFVYWYLTRFAGRSPFSHSGLDIKTFAMAMLRRPYRDCVKRNMPREWFPDRPHTHVALDDAIEQGLLFANMLAQHRR